jgi:hypothetical protein
MLHADKPPAYPGNNNETAIASIAETAVIIQQALKIKFSILSPHIVKKIQKNT